MLKKTWQPSAVQKQKLQPLSKQRILILGAGREGLATYLFLREVFPQLKLMVADCCSQKKLSADWQQYFAHDPYLTGSFGKHYLNCLPQITYIFKTPGIPPTLVPLQNFSKNGGIISSGTAWFFKLAKGKIIGVTGTKGKSTTASLIASVLNVGGKHTLLLGNIGVAALPLVKQTTSKTISVMELSAHQLQDLKVSPHISVVQNITSEHLDYYPNTAAYVSAKSSIARYQKKTDFLIYANEFKNSRAFAQLSAAKKLCYGIQDTPDHIAFASKTAIFYRPSGRPPIAMVKRRQLKLLGKHNLYNIMPAIIIGKHFGLSDELIARALSTFTPLRHRLELAGNYQGVTYINDSLSTTPQATIAALKIFASQPIHLLAGGFERQQNFTTLAQQILKQKIKSIIVFPPTGKRLKQTIINQAIAQKTLTGDFYSVTTMSQAMQLVKRLAVKGDLVLLSPAAASFGSFKDYADRGDQFCQAVANLGVSRKK